MIELYDKNVYALSFVENELTVEFRPKQCIKCKLLFTPKIYNQDTCNSCDLYIKDKYIPEIIFQDFPSV